jgi:hypothetical protein
MGATQYLINFIVKFSIVARPLHAIISKGKSFHWGETQKREFEDSKNKINDSLVLVMLNLQ